VSNVLPGSVATERPVSTDEETRLQKIEETFEAEATAWDELTRRYQTRYDEMLEELVSRVRIPLDTARALDLGCGTGILAELLLERFPQVSVVLLDASPNMLEVAEKKLARFADRVSFEQALFEEMPTGPFDAVVSTLALHHLGTDEEKKSQYERIFRALAPGGCFWQGEVVLSSSEEDTVLDELRWMDWLRDQRFTEDEVHELIERVHVNDRPAPLVDQLLWLRELGFSRVDCTWRYIMYAVFGGWRDRVVPEQP
jgi:tRNA (cmo5U34)-methyltransferase